MSMGYGPEIRGYFIVCTGPNQKMPVVLQQAPADEPQRHALKSIQHDLFKRGIVFIAAKQGDAPRCAIRHMVHMAAKAISSFSGHKGTLTCTAARVNFGCVPVLVPCRCNMRVSFYCWSFPRLCAQPADVTILRAGLWAGRDLVENIAAMRINDQMTVTKTHSNVAMIAAKNLETYV